MKKYKKKLKSFSDERGVLSVMTENNIGFKFSRIYFIKDVPENIIRGDHAHVYTKQFLVCLTGECEIKIDNGETIEYVKLKDSNSGLLVPPMNWCEITYKCKNTIMLVLASHDYDPDDYIHSYDKFKDRVRK
jgi:dTDP-4-dehydrorhamnose 3,5-epimerase-like enzyme